MCQPRQVLYKPCLVSTSPQQGGLCDHGQGALQRWRGSLSHTSLVYVIELELGHEAAWLSTPSFHVQDCTEVTASNLSPKGSGQREGTFFQSECGVGSPHQCSGHQLFCARSGFVLPILLCSPSAQLPTLTTQKQERHGSKQTAVTTPASCIQVVLQNSAQFTHNNHGR